MNKSIRSAKSIKTAMAISTAAIIVGLIGVILVFANEKRWDATGYSILASNAAIFFCNYEALKKAAETDIAYGERRTA